MVSLLLELGLPTEAASKVFLAGVRSRTAAVELGKLLRNPKVSVSKLRKALLNKETQEVISKSVSQTTLEWLHLLGSEHPTPAPALPACANFILDTPVEIDTLHVRMIDTSIFLCSSDFRYKYATVSTEAFPFHAYANNPRRAFVRDGDAWMLKDRYPNSPITQLNELFF